MSITKSITKRRNGWTCQDCGSFNAPDDYTCQCHWDAERREEEARQERAGRRDELITAWRKLYEIGVIYEGRQRFRASYPPIVEALAAIMAEKN